MLRPCWPQNPKKKTTWKAKQDKTLKRGVRENEGAVLGVLEYTENNPQNRDVQGYRNGKHALTASAVADPSTMSRMTTNAQLYDYECVAEIFGCPAFSG